MNDKKNDKSNLYRAIMHPGTLKILKILRESPMNFNDIMFESKISPSVLDRLLKQLTNRNFVSKRNGKYFLTEKGEILATLLEKVFELIQH